MWPPPRSSRRWPSSCPQRGSRFHPWEVVQASGCNSQHDNSCIACRNSPGWPGWSSHRSAPLACFTIRAPTTMRAGLLPAPLCRFFRRLLYSCSILSQGRLSASFTQRLGLAQPRETLEAQTARDCGIGSSISCRFLLILTPKGSHFK